MSSTPQRGFTLLEVLIAITITAMIGIGASQILRSAIQTNERTQTHLNSFRELQKTMLLIGRDFQQVASRASRDEYGDLEPALTSKNNDYLIAMSRTGWRNPLGDPRSDLQRVAYELREGDLYRHYWVVLDRAQDSFSKEQKLLSEVEEFEVKFAKKEGGWTSEWPTDSTNETDSEGSESLYPFTQLPRAIRLRLVHPKYGELTRIFELPLSLKGIAFQEDGKGSNGDQGADGAQEDDGGADGDSGNIGTDQDNTPSGGADGGAG